MDKQYKLTDRVSKDSIKSPIFKKWVKRVLCIVCILSLALQLTLCCLPMKASAAESVDSTWYLNTGVFDNSLVSGMTLSPSNVKMYGHNGKLFDLSTISFNSDGTVLLTPTTAARTVLLYLNSSGINDGITARVEYSPGRYVYTNTTYGDKVGVNRTLVVSGDTGVPLFDSWLKANATSSVVEEVHDFTGEIRIFNDELTLFNTSDATFTNSFNFNFEVLGVGTADYLILQRTTQNKYTMSYSFDFEDSGGLTMIYRDSPPFNNGEADWLGGKVNRKVITFISNPDDPEFQQWLLDNTTLFDNVKDAYQLGQQSGYNNGYEEGFANSLIGDSLSGPINALSQITLIEIQGTAITLGGVVMTAIALCLVLAFLKLYAGG